MRGAGPVAVMKLLSRQPKYGYELVQALKEISGGTLDMGQSTLYPLLYNLEAKALIQSEWKTMPSGRRRKYYSLTEKGRKQLKKDLEQWRALTDAMHAVGVLRPRPGS